MGCWQKAGLGHARAGSWVRHWSCGLSLVGRGSSLWEGEESWNGLGWLLKVSSHPLSHFPLDQAAPHPTQLVLEHFQEWGMLLKWCWVLPLTSAGSRVSPWGEMWTVSCFPSTLSTLTLFFPLSAGQFNPDGDQHRRDFPYPSLGSHVQAPDQPPAWRELPFPGFLTAGKELEQLPPLQGPPSPQISPRSWVGIAPEHHQSSVTGWADLWGCTSARELLRAAQATRCLESHKFRGGASMDFLRALGKKKKK